jgi:LysR family positive regulator for ilvC
MDLRSIEVFRSVCSSLSFTQTAADLHLSVSAVSRAIARLEEELGQTLFDRDRCSMRVTAAGRRFRESAERIAREWQELRRDLDEGGQLSGELRIYCSVTATRQLLSPLLAAYRRAYPAVDVLLETGDQADGVDRVRRGLASVAVIARPQPFDTRLSFRPLTVTPMCLCIPKARGDRASVAGDEGGRVRSRDLAERLDGLPWILPERGVSKAMIDRWLDRHFSKPPEIYARVAGHEAIVAMVSLGLGAGIVPRLVLDASGVENELGIMPLDDSMEALEIGLCVKEGQLANPLLSGLWDVAADVFAASGKLAS